MYNTETDYNIYIVKSYGESGSIIKLGYSLSMRNRLISYQVHNPLISVVGLYQVNNPIEFERDFHRENKALYHNEWYGEEVLYKMLEALKIDTYQESDIREVIECLRIDYVALKRMKKKKRNIVES